MEWDPSVVEQAPPPTGSLIPWLPHQGGYDLSVVRLFVCLALNWIMWKYFQLDVQETWWKGAACTDLTVWVPFTFSDNIVLGRGLYSLKPPLGTKMYTRNPQMYTRNPYLRYLTLLWPWTSCWMDWFLNLISSPACYKQSSSRHISDICVRWGPWEQRHLVTEE